MQINAVPSYLYDIIVAVCAYIYIHVYICMQMHTDGSPLTALLQ